MRVFDVRINRLNGQQSNLVKRVEINNYGEYMPIDPDTGFAKQGFKYDWVAQNIIDYPKA